MSRTGGKTIAIVALSVWLPLAAISLLPLMLSAMIFDAPGSTEAPLTIALFVSILSFPFLAGIGAVGAAILGFVASRAESDAAYRVRVRAALFFAVLPSLSVVAGIVSIVLITVICGGSFACR